MYLCRYLEKLALTPVLGYRCVPPRKIAIPKEPLIINYLNYKLCIPRAATCNSRCTSCVEYEGRIFAPSQIAPKANANFPYPPKFSLESTLATKKKKKRGRKGREAYKMFSWILTYQNSLRNKRLGVHSQSCRYSTTATERLPITNLSYRGRRKILLCEP